MVAILVMGILMTLTLGLSALVVREIRQTGDIVAAGKAFYAAEAGVETALLDLHEHLPGYQTVNDSNAEGWVDKKIDENLDYRYRIRNQGDRYPFFDADQPVYLTPGVGVPKDFLYAKGGPNEATYNVLALNQTVTIPLFVDCGDGTFKDVKNFVLEYYVDFDLDPENTLHLGNKISDFDIMRWKLFGEPSESDPSGIIRTHAISDFYPASENDSAENPVCIGSDLGLAVEDNCIPLVAKTVDINKEYISDWDSESFEVQAITNAWGLARECYAKDAGSLVAPSDIQKGCNIASFMETHKRNYLTITNVVNPDIVGILNPIIRNQRANIFYRVVAEKDSQESCAGNTSTSDVMVREYAAISSDGFANDKQVKQSVDVKLKLNSFLPVFNFTLFRTDPSKQNLEDLPPELLPL